MKIQTTENGVSFATADSLKGYKESKVAKKEDNDCVVRAIAAAFDIEYDLAHAFVAEKFERKNRKGTFMTASILKGLKKAFGKEVINHTKHVRTHYNNGGRIVERKMTLQTFLTRFSKGTFLLLKSRHAFVVKDGTVIGNMSDARKMRSRLINAFEIK